MAKSNKINKSSKAWARLAGETGARVVQERDPKSDAESALRQTSPKKVTSHGLVRHSATGRVLHHSFLGIGNTLFKGQGTDVTIISDADIRLVRKGAKATYKAKAHRVKATYEEREAARIFKSIDALSIKYLEQDVEIQAIKAETDILRASNHAKLDELKALMAKRSAGEEAV